MVFKTIVHSRKKNMNLGCPSINILNFMSTPMFKIINATPLIAAVQNFLTKDQCEQLINLAKTKLKPSEIVKSTQTTSFFQPDRRNSHSVKLSPHTNSIVSDIFDKLSQEIKIDKSRFENIEIIRYRPDESFKKHIDYFLKKELCESGGNRIATALMYLNTVEEGGETFFPWLGHIEIPVRGKLLYFNYSVDNISTKIKTEHESKPVIKGEKWAAVVWAREFPIAKTITPYRVPVDFYDKEFRDCQFDLECGPEDDRRILSISLPANKIPNNSIIVGMTGGVDSTLLLYILAQLNKLQTIPYKIQPVVVNNLRGSADDVKNLYTNPIQEYWNAIPGMVDLVREKTGSNNICNLVTKIASNKLERKHQLTEGLFSVYLSQHKNRFVHYQFIYSGSNENPPEGEIAPGPARTVNATLPWMIPFSNLQKSHIIDALLQLKLEDIIEKSPKCRHHKTLDEHCNISWQCNERRWAFRRLNKEQLGNYFYTNKGPKE